MFQFIADTVPLTGFGSALLLGLIIGLRHSTDGDHIVAVSTMARDYQSLVKGLWVGVSWGLGHSTPLLILGIIILLVKEAALDLYESVATYFEFGVAIMLIFLYLHPRLRPAFLEVVFPFLQLKGCSSIFLVVFVFR